MKGSDGIEVRAKRGQAFGFDGRFVHVGVVEVGNFAAVGTGGRVGLGRFINQARRAFTAQIRE